MGYGIVTAIVAILATAASTYVSYEGQQYNAAVAKNTAQYNAKRDENATIQADMEAREQIARDRAKNKRLMGAQRAAIGASGVQEAGSPLEVLGETAGMLELGIQDESRAAESRRRLGLSTAANDLYVGQSQAKGYELASTGTLISGAASIAQQAGNYSYNYGKKG
jgi:hypothetical protein